ncbi:MAG: penicillin-binding protein 1C [Candidatus Xenobium sp.]|jgi:penicillin-binding protein 1C|nr:penicillin-binding protein 1C [Burkholderiales bacterium]
MNRRRWGLALVLVLLLVGVLVGWPLPEELARPHQEASLILLDRHGEVLREVPSSRNGVSRWVSLDQVAPVLVQATILAEDRRFHLHPGVDPLALLRSAWINLRAGRVLTGGSTLTQQLVRNLRPPRSRGLGTKILEAWEAVRMEVRFSKTEILEAYLNRIPYGNGAYGVEAASRRYFQKSASLLSPAEAAALAVLPRAPEALDLVSRPQEVVVLQRDLLKRMGEAGLLTEEDLREALEVPLLAAPLHERFAAPHFCDMVLAELPPAAGDRQVRTSLDASLQSLVEDLLETHLERLAGQNVGNGAVVILDVATGEILALVGSRNYFDPVAGQVNAALALRSPGSTLKPFMYGMALERGRTAASVLPDLEFHPDGARDGFLPRNYDWTHHGPVRLRTALACSYNLVAARTLQELGPQSLLERLHELGFTCLDRPASHYGTGLVLGDGEVCLLDLALAYRTLARGGLYAPARPVLAMAEGGNWKPIPTFPSRRVMDPGVCFVLSDILADPEARAPAFGRYGPLSLSFPCAAKTGTSKDYRDNWTLGYTPRHVVGVWVGNFDGSSMVGASGVTGAAPLFRDLMLALRAREEAQAPPRAAEKGFLVPAGVVQEAICPVSGQGPGPDCPGSMAEWFLSGTVPSEPCCVHRRVVLDRRTGGLGGASTPDSERLERVYEVHPPLYRAWMAEVGLPTPPEDSISASRSRSTRPVLPAARPRGRSPGEYPEPPSTRPVRLAIASPEEGAVFRLDPVLRREYQKVTLRAVVPEGVPEVEWLVDGQILERCPPPFTTRWQLTPGDHTLVLRAAGVGESSVRLTVLE